MKENQINLREWIQKFDAGDFEQQDRDTQIKAGWYDWFCKGERLRNKTRVLGKKVKQIAKSPKIDLDKNYVFFKNNCPVYGRLYDDFRICGLETGDVIFTVTPNNGHDCMKGISEVYGKENSFEKPLVSGTWKDVKAFFGV